MLSQNNQPVIVADKLTRIYSLGDSDIVGLQQVNFEIGHGDLVILKGESGSGKSTLLSLMAGLDRPTSGELTVAGQNLTQASDTELTRFRREVVGMVFQSFNLMPTLSVLENACLPGLLAGKPLQETQSNATEYLVWLGLENRLNHLPAQLSGGEMQRTAIARALINRPQVVICDKTLTGGEGQLLQSSAQLCVLLVGGGRQLFLHGLPQAVGPRSELRVIQKLTLQLVRPVRQVR